MDINPLRYRGYYYDSESGLYYLQSRYYDPNIGRFINADVLITTGQGLLGNNMFTYCGNEPINRTDSTGYIHVINNSDMIAQGGCADVSLGLLFPFSWIAGLFTRPNNSSLVNDSSKTVVASPTKTAGLTISREDEQARTDTIAITADPSDVVIYRYNASKTKNLAPRIGKDYDGLSFSTIPPKPGQKAVCTTINTVNSTGLLQAIQVGTHVSIVPTYAPVTLWMATGMESIWSKTLSNIVFEVKG